MEIKSIILMKAGILIDIKSFVKMDPQDTWEDTGIEEALKEMMYKYVKDTHVEGAARIAMEEGEYNILDVDFFVAYSTPENLQGDS